MRHGVGRSSRNPTGRWNRSTPATSSPRHVLCPNAALGPPAGPSVSCRTPPSGRTQSRSPWRGSLDTPASPPGGQCSSVGGQGLAFALREKRTPQLAYAIQQRQRAILQHHTHHLLPPGQRLGRVLAEDPIRRHDHVIPKVIVVQNARLQHRQTLLVLLANPRCPMGHGVRRIGLVQPDSPTHPTHQTPQDIVVAAGSLAWKALTEEQLHSIFRAVRLTHKDPACVVQVKISSHLADRI